MARRRKRVKKKMLLAFILLIILIVGITFAFNKGDTKKDNPIKKIVEPKEVWPKVYTASLAGTGDAVLHMAVIKDAKKNDGSFDFSNQLAYIKDSIKDYDIKYYNQETIFGGDDKEYIGYPRFNSPSAFGDAMIDIGFNTVSLATNHSLDMNTSGILNAYNYWSNKNVVFNGLSDSEENRLKYTIGEVNNIKYGFLSYTTLTNGLSLPADKPYMLNKWNEEQAKKDIAYLKEQVDVVIVAMHWGVEYTTTPTEEELKIARFLADQKVDIVLGAHPHCIQPIDIIDNTVVYYSLGNFISNQGDIKDKYGIKVIIGMLATLDITKTVNEDGTKEIKIDNVGADLLYTYNKNHHDYKVIPFSKINSDYLSNYESVYNEFKGISTKLNETVKIAPLNGQ